MWWCLLNSRKSLLQNSRCWISQKSVRLKMYSWIEEQFQKRSRKRKQSEVLICDIKSLFFKVFKVSDNKMLNRQERLSPGWVSSEIWLTYIFSNNIRINSLYYLKAIKKRHFLRKNWKRKTQILKRYWPNYLFLLQH